VQVTLWCAAGVVFLVLNLQYGRELGIAVFITILLGAAVTVALACEPGAGADPAASRRAGARRPRA
jgi:hypothetical protein